MSGAEAALRAARLGDEVVHGFGLLGMVAGALIGAAIAAAIVAAGVATGGLVLVAIVGGCIAGGGLAGGALARGLSKAADLPGPTTGVLAMASPPRVTVNSRPALRAGMDFAPACSGLPMNHFPMPGPVLIAQGAQLVTVNGMPMARQSMKLVCGAKIKAGSDNVTVGGPTATVVPIHDNEEMFEQGLQILGLAALGAAGLGAVAAGVGATLVFGGVLVGMHYGMQTLHSWGESLGPGYGDIMVGVAGFALLGLGARGARTPAGRNAVDVLNRPQVANGAPARLKFQPSSGVALEATPRKTTTILGNYGQDMKFIVNELGNVKSTDFGPRTGGFNVLNVPDDLYITPKQFWAEHNQPWLGNAVARGDPILMATEPKFGPASKLFRLNDATGKLELSGFGKEYLYLRQNGFRYDPITKQMVRSP